MDIYGWAKTHDADYMDPWTGRIYKVQDYNRCIKLGLPTPGIAVYEDGVLIGYAQKRLEP